MAEDSNRWGETERRRREFSQWLAKVWEWAEDSGRKPLAARVAEVLAHADELDYPLWEMAKRIGILSQDSITESKLAKAVRESCGIPVEGPKPLSWERDINFSPAIYLDEETWTHIYRSLGWANRNTEPSLPGRNFYLWSPQGNVIRFLVREPLAIHQENDDA
jgi:hypothetical protein